ncbi:Swt1 family HEPN domain-containing protein [Aquipseudomonas alcaligenes]|uniref:Swt1 family HEPN domain-containing protein n=1 Tax=Aquipseudomonas alcaligenes TaxID=43263 RepID=UPI0035ADAF92
MKNNDALQKIKAFGMTNQMITEDLHRIGSAHSVDLGHAPVVGQAVEDIYYPQFNSSVRAEAAEMSRHYEVFYCLEKTIRELVSDTIEAAENTSAWWQTARVPPNIKAEVSSRMQKELDSAMTRRSSDELDYTTFGELSQLITTNWDIFGGIFSSRKAVEKVMASLNSLRGPIAHCSPLAEDEVLRLQITVRDWFRLME